MAEIVQGLFGISPEQLNAQREQQLQEQAQQYAQLSPLQRAASSMYQGGSRLGGAIAGMMGGADPEMQRATELQQIGRQLDLTTPEGMIQGARMLASKGYNQEAMQLQQKAQAAQQAKAEEQLTTSRTSVEQQKLAKSVLDAKQEASLRDELSNLGPNATQEDILGVVTKYGSPDKVLSALQASADRGAAREQQAALQTERLAAQKQMAQDRIDAQIEAAKQAGATRLEIAKMQNEGRQLIAGMTLSLRQQAMEDKKTEKLQKEETQKQGVAASFDSALETLDRIATHPGKGTAVGFGGTTLSMVPGTSAAGFASQLETFKAQVFLPQVQALKGMGALSDAEGKKMTASIGALDQKMKPSEFDSQVAIIKADLEKAKARVLGGSKPPAAPEAAPAAPTPTMRWNPVTKKLERL